MKIHFYRQSSTNDCGATCLRIVLGIFGKDLPIWEILDLFPLEKDGWSLDTLIRASNHFGLNAKCGKANVKRLSEITLPLIVLTNGHYIVVYKIKSDSVYVADPRIGKYVYTLSDFFNEIGDDFNIVQLNPAVSFKECSNSSMGSLTKEFAKYYIPFKKQITNVFFIVLLVSLAQLVLPFVNRSIVDIGIETSSWNYIRILIIGSILLLLTIIGGNFIQIYLFTHIANRVKTFMLEDYFAHALNIKYLQFIGMNVGDILQRVTDNERIQSYVITSLLQTFTSVLFLTIFIITLLIFSIKLGVIFSLISFIYILWNWLFLNQRKKLDFKFWQVKSENNKNIIDMYTHIVDIKNCSLENIFTKKWCSNLNNIFEQNTRYLNFSQIQEVGSRLIIQSNNLILTFLSCYYVLDGTFTLGTLFAVQYLIGIMNPPLSAIADFLNQTQLTLISLQRIQAFNHKAMDSLPNSEIVVPKYKDLNLHGVSFSYPNGKIAVSQLSLYLKFGNKYGIIGSSGCGKSTLLKIINGILEPTYGNYIICNTNSKALGCHVIRRFVSAYLQENTIFNGTILQNIVCGNLYDEARLLKVVEISAIRREIEVLPLSYNTVIGSGHINLSRGQQQRLLIARTLYKDADVYLFDEITNCLDYSTGNKIISKIDLFLSEKTRIYVTHQTEYLKDAASIYCLNSGFLIDFGKYEELCERNRISK